MDFNNDEDIDSKLCSECGKLATETHECDPNNGEYNPMEWAALLETRKRVAARILNEERREAAIKKKEAAIKKKEAAFERTKREILTLRQDVNDFSKSIREFLMISSEDSTSGQQKEMLRDSYLSDVEKRLRKHQGEIDNFSKGYYKPSEINLLKDIFDEVEDEIEILAAKNAWHMPTKIEKSTRCTCIEYPSIECAFHPGRQ